VSSGRWTANGPRRPNSDCIRRLPRCDLFKGVASILESGALYDKAIAFYKDRASRVIAIREVSPRGE
jgi:hypothetical protein